MILEKRAHKPHYRIFTLISFVFILMATPAERSFATPMDYIVTGDITGTINMDFMLPNLASPAVFSWSLTHLGLAQTWTNLTDDQPPSSTRTNSSFLGFQVDTIRLITTNSDDWGLQITFIGPTNTTQNLPFTFDGVIIPPPPATTSQINGRYTTASVPLPNTLGLFAAGFLGLVGSRWLHRRVQRQQVG